MIGKSRTVGAGSLRSFVLFLVATLAASLLLLAVGTKPAEAAYPGENGKIAFRDICYGCGEWSSIITVNPDGTDARDVGDDPKLEFLPSFSPDGTKIAFGRSLDEEDPRAVDLWVMDADGSNQRIVVPSTDGDAYYTVTWSPNGKKLAYIRTHFGDDGGGPVYMTNADGSGTPERIGDVFAYDLAWSPDGSKLAFEYPFGNGVDDGGIYTMNPDGSEVELIIPGFYARSPSWAPNGRKIAFSTPGGGISVANSDGTGKQRQIVADGSYPAFSPDGTKIAFMRDRYYADCNCSLPDIFTTNASDGSAETLVASKAAAPDWQPIPAVAPCTITGTPGDDDLDGTSGDDAICGFGGNDTILALGGNDRIRVGNGDDRAYGGSGEDRIYGHNGIDRINGGRGTDRLNSEDGVSGNDTLNGGTDGGVEDTYLTDPEDRIVG